MTKKKAIQPDADGYVDRGIYREYDGPPVPVGKVLDKDSNQPLCFQRLVLLLEEMFEKVTPYLAVDELGPPIQISTRPGESDFYPPANQLKEDAPADIQDALGAIYKIDYLLRVITEKSKPPIVDIINESIALGRILEMMHVRQFEKPALIGKKRQAASQKAVEITNSDHKELWDQYPSSVEEEMKKGMSYTKATEMS